MSITSVIHSISTHRAPVDCRQRLSLVTAERDADGRYPVIAVWIVERKGLSTPVVVPHGFVEQHELHELHEYSSAAIATAYERR